MTPKILVIEDDGAMGELLEKSLSSRGFEVTLHVSANEALDAALSDNLNAIVTDMHLDGLNGIEFCSRIAQSRPNIPVLVMTAFGSMDTAIEALRAGAYDFMPKPLDMDALALALQRAVKHQALQEEVRRLRAVVQEGQGFDEILGNSAPMQRLYDLLSRAARADASVLVTGETGTGKELVARALHKKSERSGAKFVAINCAALPAQLLESEFFGHVKGAYTDAKCAHEGIFVQAHGGTVFLDEIAELPIHLQPKLLRALQERKVRPLGSDKEVPFDVRLITATNKDLGGAIESGEFREDLYYRINVLQVDLPPLRTRGNDILLLAQLFLERFAALHNEDISGFTAPAAERLLAYSWPGNVRELENCVQRAVALAHFERIVVDDFPEKIRNYYARLPKTIIDAPKDFPTLQEMQRRYILRVLDVVDGNRAKAARILGIDRKTLYRKAKRLGISEEAGRNGHEPDVTSTETAGTSSCRQ